MDPIFDKAGKFVSWLSGEAVIDARGKYRAFIVGETVLDYNSHYLGRFSHGYFWDGQGRAIAFTPKASGKPFRPRTGSVNPYPSVGLEPRRPSMPPSAPKAMELKHVWSNNSWDDFLRTRAGID